MFIPIYEIITDYKSVIPSKLTLLTHHHYEKVKIGNERDHWTIFDYRNDLIPRTNDGCVFLGNNFTVHRQTKGNTLPTRIDSSVFRYENKRMRPMNNTEVKNFNDQPFVEEANDHNILLDNNTIHNTIYRRILKDWKIDAVEKVEFELKHLDGTSTKLLNYGVDSDNVPKINVYLMPSQYFDRFDKHYPEAYKRNWAYGKEMIINMGGFINILRFYSTKNPIKLMEWGTNSVISKMSEQDMIARDVLVMLNESGQWLDTKYVAYEINDTIANECGPLLDPLNWRKNGLADIWVVLPFVEWAIKLKQHNRTA